MSEGGFLYLNRENTWGLSNTDRDGLQIGERGELTLARLPGLADAVSDPLPPSDELDRPVAFGVGLDGAFFLADPTGHRLLRVDPCDRSVGPFGALAGRGPHPGQLDGPRGVLVGPRHSLYVVDGGNHRVQIVDLRTGQLRAIWGQAAPWDAPTLADVPGRFRNPRDLALDRLGNLYVVDLGERDASGAWVGGRVQKLDPDGRVDLDFAANLAVQPVRPAAPAGIAITPQGGADPDTDRLLVLDRGPLRLLAFRADGSYDEPTTERWSTALDEQGAAPIGALAAGDVLYIVDGAGRRLLAFGHDGTPRGVVRDAPWPIAGLASDRRGRAVVRAAGGGPLRSVAPGRDARAEGTFVLGPIGTGERPISWQRLVVDGDLPTGTHLRLHTATTADADPPTPPGSGENGVWDAAPPDALDLLVPSAPGPRLWIAGRLIGDGTRSPRLRQIRLEYGQEGWLAHLPAIFRRDDEDRAFLARLLALFESLLAAEARRIDDLPLLFDPSTAPDEAPSSWLDWLAGWLALELDDRWEPERRRLAPGRAFELYGRRGTLGGLREIAAFATGVEIRIEEPAQFAALWSLGETSSLGLDTMLASAEPGGAVVGRTAALDQSHLIADDEYGAPLFEDVAHRFCAQVRAADLRGPEALDDLRRLLEREKPAHTIYHLWTIEPRLRVGFQARVGIDAIVGGPTPDLILDGPGRLGRDTALPDDPDRPTPGVRIGQEARVGWRATVV